MQPSLRPYQSENKTAIHASWIAGNRNVLYVLPTGGGKSVVVSNDVAETDARGVVQAVVAHRQELVGQMSLHVARTGVKHRIIGPKNVVSNIVAEHRREFGRSFIDPSARCAVAGVDTLISRKVELASWAQQVGRWTIDEAHHVIRSNKWGTAVNMFPNAYGLGVTATPQRADGQGLGRHADGVFDDMVLGPSMRELIDMGSLTDYEFAIPESDFPTDELKVTEGGDFSPKQMREASKKSRIVGDVVVNWCTFALGKQAIVFATDVETCNEMAANFNRFGIPAAAVSANTPDNVRSEYITRFRNGQLRILVNVDLFGEGFDLPAIECVIMARPTMSLAVYLQQLGRALRLMPGKKFGLIIDMVSNFKIHKLPDRPRMWTLDRREKRAKKAPDPDDLDMTSCTHCYKPFEAVHRCCPWCGELVPTAAGGGGGRSIEQVDGDLMLLDAAALAKLREGIQLESPMAIAQRRGAVAGRGLETFFANQQIERITAQQELERTIDQWAGYQRHVHGRPDHEIHRRFYKAAGLDVISAMKLDRAGMETLRATVEGWIK